MSDVRPAIARLARCCAPLLACFMACTPFTTVQAQAQVPASRHVFLVVLENHGYASAVGNPAMPYLNGLIARSGLATQYYANTHPSIGNYFVMTTGRVISNDDGFSAIVDDDNIVRHLAAAGKSWRSYAQSLPYAGFLGTAYPYARHHDPFTYFSDVVNDAEQGANLVPWPQFAQDLASGRLPDFAFLLPDLRNDGHDCPAGMTACTDDDELAAADRWMQANLDPLLASAAFLDDGLLIVTFDEAAGADVTHGGGHVATVIAGPRVKPAYRATTFYQHESLLGLMCDALRISCPAGGADAPRMAEFFSSDTSPPPITATAVEFYRPAADHYFLTSAPAEIAALDSGALTGWQRTGQTFNVWRAEVADAPGRSPVCRFYGRPEAGLDSHFHSASRTECALVASRYPAAWLLESPDVFAVAPADAVSGACPVGTVAVYRVYDNRPDANHRYTPSLDIAAAMRARGWLPEGYGPSAVAFCVPG